MRSRLFILPTNIIILLAFMFSTSGCTYYMMRKDNIKKNDGTYKTNQLKKANYYLLHVGDEVWQLENVKFTDSLITGTPVIKDEKANTIYSRVNKNQKYTGVYGKRKTSIYYNQVHIHSKEFKTENNQISLDWASVNKIEIFYSINKGWKAWKKALIITGSVIGGIILFLAVACGCPHVYIKTPDGYKYNNTLFTGATSSKLERNDFKQIKNLSANENKYNLIIRNEDQEIQKINFLQLIEIHHPKNEEVFSDQSGKFYTITNKIFPNKITNNKGEPINHHINSDDEEGYEFNQNDIDDFSDVYLQFNKSKVTDNAKLILKLKNTPWAAFVYQQFQQKFGTYYDNWVKSNNKKSRQEINNNLTKMGIKLNVSIKTKNGWQELESVDLIGDISYNTLVIPIDSTLLDGNDINIKLRSGYRFWNIDYAAMDYSKPKELHITCHSPVISNQNNNNNDMLRDDNKYLILKEKGDSVEVEFSNLSSLKSNNTRSLFIQSKGYYLPQQKFEGKPEWSELKKFKNPSELSRYSKFLYDIIQNTLVTN